MNEEIKDLLETIILVNELLIDLHDLPILEKLNEEISSVLNGGEK